jgi:hypothetical protein
MYVCMYACMHIWMNGWSVHGSLFCLHMHVYGKYLDNKLITVEKLELRSIGSSAELKNNRQKSFFNSGDNPDHFWIKLISNYL